MGLSRGVKKQKRHKEDAVETITRTFSIHSDGSCMAEVIMKKRSSSGNIIINSKASMYIDSNASWTVGNQRVFSGNHDA